MQSQQLRPRPVSSRHGGEGEEAESQWTGKERWWTRRGRSDGSAVWAVGVGRVGEKHPTWRRLQAGSKVSQAGCAQTCGLRICQTATRGRGWSRLCADDEATVQYTTVHASSDFLRSRCGCQRSLVPGGCEDGLTCSNKQCRRAAPCGQRRKHSCLDAGKRAEQGRGSATLHPRIEPIATASPSNRVDCDGVSISVNRLRWRLHQIKSTAMASPSFPFRRTCSRRVCPRITVRGSTVLRGRTGHHDVGRC